MAANQQSGKDKGVLSSTLEGLVVDKSQRDKIATFSKSAHFTFSSYGKWSPSFPLSNKPRAAKRCQTTHEAFYP